MHNFELSTMISNTGLKRTIGTDASPRMWAGKLLSIPQFPRFCLFILSKPAHRGKAVKKIDKIAFITLLFFLLSSDAFADFQFTFNGHTYDVITSGMTWADASADAQNKSINGEPGYLARIDSVEENDEVFAQISINISPSDFENTLAPDGGGASYVWIGANDIQTEGKWIWVDNGAQFWQGNNTGSAVDALYNNWGNEPDDFNSQDAAGVALNDWPRGVAGQWNDVDTNNTLYYIIEYPTVLFNINAAMSDAWFYPVTSGQGFFIIVWEGSKTVFLAWFTYDTERPPDDISAILGEPGHRWIIGLGDYDGDTADLDVFLSSGMIFNSGVLPVDTVQYPGATMEIVWSGCNKGLVKYNIPSLMLMGEVPIERIVEDNVPACMAAQP
jgi:hypothetical protein